MLYRDRESSFENGTGETAIGLSFGISGEEKGTVGNEERSLSDSKEISDRLMNDSSKFSSAATREELTIERDPVIGSYGSCTRD